MILNYIFIVLFGLLANPYDGKLELQLNKLDPAGGTIYIAIYKYADTFMEEDKAEFRKIVDYESETQIIVLDLPQGDYAITVFQDLNDNQRLDTRLMGIPKEPYGFSNNAMGMFGPPSFEKAKISVGESSKTEIDMR